MHNVVGQAAALASLAELALLQSNTMAARRLIQESFASYRKLYASISAISDLVFAQA
jgi:hypothetical protein